MALITVRPTAADVAIANFVATHTNLPTEETAGALTWGADEHILLGMTAAWWFYTRNQERPNPQNGRPHSPNDARRVGAAALA